ncbi:MAG TPA: hypothetical protein VGY90_06290 [Steroidobacteraceae bacterium]|jgi:hypothetical protein|nr:hypothetical protein [Steroidobacteraceae bacterium]
MAVRRVLLTVLVAAALWQGYTSWQLRPLHPSDGPIAPEDPRQTDIEEAPVTMLGRWRLTPRARYDITARILSREDYHFDLLSDLIPEDLALGWGPMSDNRILRAFEITQGARFYSWRPKQDLVIPRQAVIEHSANTHLIPADAGVRRQLKRLRVGQVVHLSGFLVNAVRDDGTYINTSLTRSDTGPGSCEVVLVEQVEAR